MNVSAFDYKATGYDEEFTYTYVGNYQRKLVHRALSNYFSGNHDMNILEINCGTGEDIGHLQQYGNVLATDVSQEMLRIAKIKNPRTSVEMLDFSKPIELNQKFDLIFSNFGGLNCVNPSRLRELNKELADHLNPGGHLIMVLMHNWSLVEWSYFMLKINFKKAGRRLSGHAEFNKIPIYYYSESETRNIFNSFSLIETIPIGVLLSGEYMNRYGRFVGQVEPYLSPTWPVLGADHILYTFIRR